MTYLQFHLVFIVPPLLLLLVLPGRAWQRREVYAAIALMLIALVYTTPWDNYLVATGVWGYGAGRVLGTIGWVPVEEYLFFLLQPILVFAWVRRTRLLTPESHGAVVRGAPAASAAAATSRSAAAAVRIAGSGARRVRGTAAVRIAGTVVWLLLALAGAILLILGHARYLALILAWAAPVLAGQWWLTGDVFAHRTRAYASALVPPTLLLWVADAFAISRGIWHIVPEHTIGVRIGVLPLEEMLFFLVTNLLVVHGAILLLEPARVRVVSRATVTA
jgi:lycopene cyclase domain-containing protein